MSGGVDSAVAAARAVDAGHDVTGVHLALSSNPQSFRSGARGCCTLEDARDARRAADVIGIPFYVWDMAERFRADVIDDFVAEYAAGRTPNPCLRCNEKIKFAAVLDKARALDFDAVCTGHYARIEDGRLRRAADHDKDQSYVLGVLTVDQLAGAMFPLGPTPRPRCAPRPTAGGSRWPTSPTATTSASSPTATPARSCATSIGAAPGPDRRHRRHDGRRARRCLRVHGRPATRAADRSAGRRRQAALRPRHLTGHGHRHGRVRRAARRRPAHRREGPLVRAGAARTGRVRRADPRARRAGRLCRGL